MAAAIYIFLCTRTSPHEGRGHCSWIFSSVLPVSGQRRPHWTARMLRLSFACVVRTCYQDSFYMSLLLSIFFTKASNNILDSLYDFFSREGGGLLKHICHVSSSLKRINTLSGGAGRHLFQNCCSSILKMSLLEKERICSILQSTPFQKGLVKPWKEDDKVAGSEALRLKPTSRRFMSAYH